MQAAARDVKRTSFICLSILCFALADVRDGLGPFFGVYLQSLDWEPDEIGYVMTIGGLAELLLMTPLGAVADASRRKRALMAASVLIMMIGCGLVFVFDGAPAAVASKLLAGAAAAAIAPALASITLGLTCGVGYAERVGRNEAWSHAGNASTAVTAGLVGYFFGIPGVFMVMSAMALLALAALKGIRPEHIDLTAARGASKASSRASGSSKNQAGRIEPFKELLQDKALLAVGATLFCFHLGNAAMLPLLGQSAVAHFDVDPAVYTAATVVLAQCTMILTALWGAKRASSKGFGLLFVLALTALPVRGLIAGFWDDPLRLIPIQLLDGVGAGLLGVATPGLVERLLRGTGRVNTGLGLVLTIQGLGAALSNTYGGFVAHQAGYGAAFLALALAPCAGLAVIGLASMRFERLYQALTSR